VTAVPDGLVVDRERTSVRVVLLDAVGRVLLFRTVDPEMPETGQWWELPGGGMEAGESVAQTAVREVAEETGLVLAPDTVGAPTWFRAATYCRRHRRVLQHEMVVAVRLGEETPAVVGGGRTADEREEYLGHRWWEVTEVTTSTERFFPGRLAELLPRFLADERIDEPFEHWN
jgi:8-oxo-dGTP pyrophosphatase MutT (NUDIX family)